MKTLQELKALRDKTLPKVVLSEDSDAVRIVVGMATCGIAAGAKPVYDALKEEIERRGLKHVQVIPTGCIGVCRLEPLVEVYEGGQEKVTYVRMTPDKVPVIVSEHIVNKRVVGEYTISVTD